MQQEDCPKGSEDYQALLMVLPIPLMVMEADQTISFINPAFEKTFGWTLDEIRDRLLDFIPEDQLIKTATGKLSLIKSGELNNFETKRFTKDGRLLDVIYDGAKIYDTENRLSGLIIALKDITQRKRAEFINRSLYQISNALHSYHSLDDLLNYISKQTRPLLEAGRAYVMLLDEKDETFFCRAEDIENTTIDHKTKKLKISAIHGVSGEVRRMYKPIVVNDYTNSPLAADRPTRWPKYRVHCLLQVPILIENKLIGILCAENKKSGVFNEKDVEMLSTIAGVVASPIENARINRELRNSYQEIKSLNKAKDSIIDRLSHELRTPLAVIRASLHLLAKAPSNTNNENAAKIVQRVERNINRLLEMQIQLDDIKANSQSLQGSMMAHLLRQCIDDLENLVFLETGESVGQRIFQKIKTSYFPPEVDPQIIDIGPFVDRVLNKIKPAFAHRRIDLLADLHDTANIHIPSEALEKIVTGLIKNAVENTPDGGKIEIKINRDANKVFLHISDTGVGVTEENKQLLFKSYFTTRDVYNYSTGQPYNFNAGGSGFELLRIKIFSERYHFKIALTSNRCSYVPTDKDICQGKISDCRYLRNDNDCFRNGGTIFTIEFNVYSV